MTNSFVTCSCEELTAIIICTFYVAYYNSYGKCSKIHTQVASKIKKNKPRQTVQTQIRPLLKKQSDQGIHCLLSRQAFFEFQLFLQSRKLRKIYEILEHLPKHRHCIFHITLKMAKTRVLAILSTIGFEQLKMKKSLTGVLRLV